MPLSPLPDRRVVIAGAIVMGALPGASVARAHDGAISFPRSQAVLDGHVAEGRLPGAVFAVRGPDGNRTFLRAGRLAFGPAPEMDDRSLFRIYSLTKLITGAAAAILIQDGRLRLDQPVVDFLPEFAALRVAVDPARGLESEPVRKPMTTAHLLTHTSGLTYHYNGETPVHLAYRKAGIFPTTGTTIDPRPALDGDKIVDLDQMAERLAGIPLMFQPGTAYDYGVSLDVLGLLIQRASGQSYPDFVQSRILDPMGMTDTVWFLDPAMADRLTSFYAFVAPRPVLLDGPQKSAWSIPTSLFAGGAGLISSSRDILAFLSMVMEDGRHQDRAILDPATARLIRSDILPAGATGFEGQGHGFGGYVRRTDEPAPGGLRRGAYGHYGAAGTTAWIDPTSGVAAAVMIQQYPLDHTDVVRALRIALAADLAAGATA